MTNIDKGNILSVMLSEAIPNTEIAQYISAAEEIVLTQLYPYGYDEKTVVPKQYERLQIQIAAEMYAKKGAEGQIYHAENGITRQWSAGDISPALLKRIIPHCGSL